MLKKWMSMDKKEVIYKSQDDSVGIISKTQPAQKIAELEDTRILPAAKEGQKKPIKDSPHKIQSGSKRVMKLNRDYAKEGPENPIDEIKGDMKK